MDSLEQVVLRETVALNEHDRKRSTALQLIVVAFMQHGQECKTCKAFYYGNGLPLGVVCERGHSILINIFNL